MIHSGNIKMCFSKKRYSSEGLANTVAQKVLSERNIKLRAYYCTGCAGFHLTKRILENSK